MENMMARTLLDVQLARLLYPLLIELAMGRQIATYGQLIELAKKRYPSDPRIKNLIPVRMGRILWVIYDFVEERDLPRLTLIIVSAGDKNPGSAMLGHDFAAEQQRCFEFNWSTIDQEFDMYAQSSEKESAPVRRISRESAIALVSAHYHDPANSYPNAIRALRETIIEHVMNGLPVADAFEIEAQLIV